MENLREIELDIDKLRGNSMKKRVIFFITIGIICLIVAILFDCFSYNENFNCSEIKKIQYIQYLGEYEVKEYVDYEDIKDISQKLQELKFYSTSKEKLQESPIASICVLYMDGSKKRVSIAGMMALIENITIDNEISEGNIYYINPINLKKVFRWYKIIIQGTNRGKIGFIPKKKHNKGRGYYYFV